LLDTSALIGRLERLNVAVVADILDTLGHREQVMAPRVRPLFEDARLAGRARTVLVARTDRIPDRRDERYRLQLQAIEGLQPGDVIVTSPIDVSFWGELMSTAARAKRSPGIVVDGYVRDVEALVAMRFPTFCAGVHAADSLGRCEVVEIGGAIVSGEVTVHDGDLVHAGRDGVVIVPAAAAEQTIAAAEEKLSGENVVKARLEEGLGITEAFLTYGIL
jgi:4-hydroxy-4-methyl-2-oxoglutarate aldolase